MKRALINIDYTYDFVAVDGKLTCGKPGQDIEAQIVSLTKEFIKAGDFVAFGIDAHEEEDTYHPESALFPPHNIRGTSGKELYGQDRKSTRLNSSHVAISYAVFCLKKKKKTTYRVHK